MGITAAQMRELVGEFDVIETPYNINTTVSQVAKYDGSRWAIMFGCYSSTTVYISTLPTVASGKGFQASTSGGFLVLNFPTVGPLVNQAWYAVGSGVATLTVFEVFFRDRSSK